MNCVAQPGSRFPTSQEQMSFVSAQMAAHVQASPQNFFSAVAGVTFFSFAAT
jgi:hypothetical protein